MADLDVAAQEALLDQVKQHIKSDCSRRVKVRNLQAGRTSLCVTNRDLHDLKALLLLHRGHYRCRYERLAICHSNPSSPRKLTPYAGCKCDLT